MKILTLNERDMQEAMPFEGILASMRKALIESAEGKGEVPQRLRVNIPQEDGQTLLMPGYAKASRALGVKIVSVFPKNPEKGLPGVPSVMLLLNEETGEVLALLDGTALTRWRTGALAGVATDALARKEARTMLLIGVGGQAESQLLAVSLVRSLEKVWVYDLDPRRAEAFAQAMSETLNLSVRAVEDLSAILSKADIVTTVTTSRQPVFDAALLSPGCHVNGIGSYTKEMSEIPVELLQRAALIYVDTKDAIEESGDFQKPLAQGTFALEQITGELGALLAHKAPGRRSKEEITFFESTGNALFDVVCAKDLYEAAREKGLGQMLEL
ncbi:Ornithine cyclodeaminase [Clostridiaceae bacterium JG1575]|nr:Ornithine cyclodeaminase [Clostridiaceae bacterium JG1575]